jgi:tryptophan synthase alpha subunit
MLLLVSWETATGATATTTQIHGAERQIHSVFLHSPQLLGLSNASRQEMAEHVAYQIVLGSAAKREYMRAGDQAQLAHLRELASSVLQQQGVDLGKVKLTEQGFSRKN